ncbi:hypothetical protein FJ651_05585 [Paucihalobacter ruber]|uniref:Outer membrane protein beta-barrel domain-containing protein n=1 Tax=Paucihalobacter ruber TaxID=2567861 RepID=A0A506PN59_9FLAO|nr:hypothetical protein [Paucihalobacter ruber]TPV34999.1 hypothetical protein FJ651_05585 [Paucihalobacter ruber]
MKEKKNIDRLFQEKLKDFEVHPQPHVWDHIEANLNQKEKDRKVVPFWWRLGGIAAALVVMLGIGFNIWNRQNNTSGNTIVDQETETLVKDALNSPGKKSTDDSVAFEEVSKNETLQNESATTTSGSPNSSENIMNGSSKLVSNSNRNRQSEVKTNESSSVNQTNSQLEKSKVAHAEISSEENKTIINQTGIAQNNNDLNKDESSKGLNNIKQLSTATSIVENQINKDLEKDIVSEKIKEEKSIEEAIAELEEITNEKEEEVLNRWRISPNVAPVYFNSLGEGSSIHSQFNENGKSTNINMSYGIAASYAINKKLKIRTGVSNVNFDYRTNDVMTTNGLARSAANSQSSIPNIKLNQNAGTSNFMSGKAVSLTSAPEIVKSSNMVSLEQQFGFIEVPLELEYSLVDKKLGLNVIGGFSTFFLNNNNLFLVEQGGSSLIGESANLNDISYSANFGLGMFYNFSKAFQFNLEPMFKYQINTFNNTSGDFQPFFMGVYTGLSFKF